MTAESLLLVGAAAVVLAALLIGTLALLPSRAVSRDRRRWNGDAPTSALSGVAQAASAGVERLLGGRALTMSEALVLAGIRQTPQEFAILVAIAALVLLAVGVVLGAGWLGLLLALLAVPAAWAIVSLRTARRRRAFGRQLDEVLQLLSGSLRAGYSLPQAISTVATELEEPASTEFARVVNQVRVGRPLVQAMEDASRRLRNDDFFWVVQAVAINREVGGNLADVLEGVAATIRERVHLKRQVEALAADGTFSAIILTLLPVVMMGLLLLVNPGYIGRLLGNPVGILLLIAAGILLAIGALWMRVLVQIKF